MKKTSMRLNNQFIAFDKGEYFQSDIDVLDDWKESDIDISLNLEAERIYGK